MADTDLPSQTQEPRLIAEWVAPKSHPGSPYIRSRLQPSHDPTVRPTTVEDVRQVSAQTFTTSSPSLWRRIKHAVIGAPIPTERALHERIGKAKALAVLSSDALSSVAYATEASMAVLITAGIATLQRNIGIGVVVIALLAIVAISYRQTIFHYPNGGGSYIVAKDNLNVHCGLIAAAALLIDYVLTVSVSVSAGVDALATAFPRILPFDVWIGVALVGVILLVNLRGVRESGTIFAAPTYIFVASFILMEAVGIIHALGTGGLLHAVPPNPTRTDIAATEHLGAFLILTAFASGCSAMTGTEAISNGVPVFKPPQERNAAATLTWMAALLGVMYGGTTYLAWRYGVLPNTASNPTVIGQLAQMFFTGGFGWFFYVFQFATMAILVLAANTSFADFPRLSSILARDDFLPHIFSAQGDRLAFNTGIIALGVLSSVLLAAFHGRTDALINLYAVGVFVAFTMSQAGMVRRWLARREAGWRFGLPVNLLGAVATGIVALVVAVSKFDRGAWIVVILIPLLYLMFRAIQRHYQKVRDVALTVPVRDPASARHLVVAPIARLDNLALRGLAYARTLSPFVIAVHVAMSHEEAEHMRADWKQFAATSKLLRKGPQVGDRDEDAAAYAPGADFIGPLTGPELVLVDSPYRALTRPIVQFIDALQRAYPADLITVVLPEYVTTNLWESLLHNQTALRLKFALLTRPRIVTANVPYRLTPAPRALLEREPARTRP